MAIDLSTLVESSNLNLYFDIRMQKAILKISKRWFKYDFFNFLINVEFFINSPFSDQYTAIEFNDFKRLKNDKRTEIIFSFTITNCADWLLLTTYHGDTSVWQWNFLNVVKKSNYNTKTIYKDLIIHVYRAGW